MQERISIWLHIAGWVWQLFRSFMREEFKLAMKLLFEV